LKSIEPSEYPVHRNWNAKVFSLPKIPRGNLGQPVILRRILKAIIARVPYNTKMEFNGSVSHATLEQLCVWLRPIGIVYLEDGTWKVSEEGKKYLESNDDLYLTAIYCANVRFTGELLANLNSPKRILELINIANKEYHLNWETKSEIGNRLTWFRQLELVKYHDVKYTYSLTDKGSEFVENINYVHPNDIDTYLDPTTEEKDIPVSEWVAELVDMNQEKLLKRKQSIGYIPGNISEICDTLNGFIQLMYSTIDKQSFYGYAKETYNISSNSSNAFVTALTNIGFLERKTRNTYGATELAKNWLKSNSPIDLVYCLHAKMLFVFEILKELEKDNLSVKELTAIAKVSYGFETERPDEIRKRLNIMQSALLIQEKGQSKYSLTQRGKNVLEEVLIQEKVEEEKANKIQVDNANSGQSDVDKYFTELRLASRDSSNPIRFEKAIASIFNNLGFYTSQLGGAGQTDVLIHSPSIPKHSYTVALDAKSSRNGLVSEGHINFDTLKEHKKLHSADYIAVVGYSFSGERLIKRASSHKVGLIDIDVLEEIIRSHQNVPLQADAYKEVFCQSGIVDTNCLDKYRRSIVRSGKLLQSIMECLVLESNDPVTEGLLQEKDVYRTLRHEAEFGNLPSIDEISEMLQFLSSPLIGCVGRTNEGYYALGTLLDAKNKFNFYAQCCKVQD